MANRTALLFALPYALRPMRNLIDPRLLSVAVIWGVNFSFVKFSLADFSPLSFTILRFSLSAIFLLAIMFLYREPFSLERRDIGAVVMLGCIGITLYNLFFMFGLNFTSASNSALFISLSPLFAALILAVMKRERINSPVVAGLLLATAGVFLVIHNRAEGLSFSRQALTGDLLTLFAALFWALYTIKAGPLLERYSAIKVTAYSMAAGSILLLPIGAHELLRQSWSAISLRSWSAFAFATFISGGIAFTLWYQGVKKIGATRTIAYHYLVPFVAVLFAALFLNERITLLQITGGICILSGVFLVQSKHDQA